MFFKTENENNDSGSTRVLPVLPLRDVIVFPHMVSQLFVGRERSIAALEEAMSGDKEIFLAAQKNAKTNDPQAEDIFAVGTVGVILQLLRLADGTVKVLIEGRRRAQMDRFSEPGRCLMAEVTELADENDDDVELEALLRTVQNTFEVYVKLNKKIQAEVLVSVQSIDDASKLADTIASNLPTLKVDDRQELLGTSNVKLRLERVYELMQGEIEILQVEKKIRSRVKKQMEKTQKEYYLNEQMQAIQRELGGEKDEFRNEQSELDQAIRDKNLTDQARERCEKESRKLKMMHPTSAEATVVRNYIDTVLSLPWNSYSEEKADISAAEVILDEDHYGLSKVKERILEYLAVQQLTGELKGPILCLVGPPGVGKTSLARSIAKATGREYTRISLGGVRDEAEIRGHRRTYIGAMPGKILMALKRAGKSNPLVLLDEIDKMSSDFRGDPGSAMLEVLDPEQNSTFVDHYLDLDYDLSKVLFVTTANSLSGIPGPLRDRMEIIELTGYTEYEKLSIASKYLVARQREENGLNDVEIQVDEAALRVVIHHYTKEAGVRSLERQISKLYRKLAFQVVKSGKGQSFDIQAKDIPTYLGMPKFRLDQTEKKDEIGLTHGLSVSDYGGDILDCEVTVLPGKGKLNITGLLEKGMTESAQAALSYIRSRAQAIGLSSEFYQESDIHVHFPEFVRKDGPSAGVTMATSICSALTKVPVRCDIAMTGEITLRGRVMPIGGLKEKLLAAHRAGMTTVFVPKENRKDLKEVPRRVLSALRIVLVDHADDVLREALVGVDTAEWFGPRKLFLEFRNGVLLEGQDAVEKSGDSETPRPQLGMEEFRPSVS